MMNVKYTFVFNVIHTRWAWDPSHPTDTLLSLDFNLYLSPFFISD